MNNLQNIYKGGWLVGKRTYIISSIGILSAIGSYLTGDINIFEMLNRVFPLAAIYFLRKGLEDGNK